MINIKSRLFSLLALCTLTVALNAQAQEFGFGHLDSDSFPSLGSVNASTSTHAATGVNTLPADYLAGPAAETVEKELAASHASTNLMVLSGLAAMLGLGMGITGLCILRRQPKRSPAPLMHTAIPSLQGRT